MDTRSHKTKACSVWRKANNLVVHPWLLRNEATANRAEVEDESQIFRSHLDDSLEVLSENDTSLTQPSSASQHACHVSVTGMISSDKEDKVPD